jgi:hypothetical protein
MKCGNKARNLLAFGYFHLSRLDRNRQSALCANFNAARDGFLNISDRFFLGLALAHAPGNRWAFSNPNAISSRFRVVKNFMSQS